MKTITITKTIPAPPDGWEWQDRFPNKGESFIRLTHDHWDYSGTCEVGPPEISGYIYAYRVRDEYAEKYEALKLPDGWARCEQGDGLGVTWCQNEPSTFTKQCKDTRRIINGKAYKIGEEPK